MSSIILTLIILAVIYTIVDNLTALRKNVALAKKSGIPYIIVPVYFMKLPWLVGHRLVTPLLKKLPTSWTEWVDFTIPDFTFHYSYEVFRRVGHDTFLTVSPGGICMYTCEPPAISTITTQRSNFPKPTHIYSSLDIYGKNVVTTEQDVWRKHRKATSPPFTEKNNHLVWTESIHQAQAMLKSWTADDMPYGRKIDRIMDDTMRLALNVISAAGFGRRMDWPTDETETIDEKTGDMGHSKIKNDSREIDPGHEMSYTYAIHCVLKSLLLQILFPKWLLARIPSTAAKTAAQAYNEWERYMKELLLKKKQDLESDAADRKANDILTQLVKDQLMDGDAKQQSGASLTEREVLGNMFIFILAGHETSANSIHFSTVSLALFPESQRRLQKDLDTIFQGKPPNEWQYDQDLPQLFGGMAGAVLAEELRLFPPVTGVPKSTMEGVGPQKLVLEGKECLVPADTYVVLCTGAAHRHPGYWPAGKSRLPGGHTIHPVANLDNDLEEFRPERWLLTANDEGEVVDADGIPVETLADGKDDGLGVNESSDTSDRLYKPTKGSYFPFSDGYRSCLGRRFAQVEVLAVLAVLFQNYSVELDASKYATDEELGKMSIDEKAEIWHKASEDARLLILKEVKVLTTLQLLKGTIPVRFVRRGKECFPDDIDEIWKKNHPDQVSGKGRPGWSIWAGDAKK